MRLPSQLRKKLKNSTILEDALLEIETLFQNYQ